MKTTPNEQQLRDELRALDAWIALNLFGWNFNRGGRAARYTMDFGRAMQVLKKCCARIAPVGISWLDNGTWLVGGTDETSPYGEAETLPLAICRFARSLFESEGKK